MICNTLIGQFCFEHAEDWEEILSNEPYNLKISKDDEYVMFKYNQLSSDFNEPIVREARGIIFKEHKWDYPVCHAFDKFGNYGESYVHKIDWSTAKVTEKIDGSLIKMWFYNDCWRISTNGMIKASYAEFPDVHYDNYSQAFVCALKNIGSGYEELIKSLNKNCTYMFELVGPYNRVVIPYEKENVYYLGCRHNESGNEYPFYSDYTKELIDLTNISIPKLYDMNNLEDVVNAAKDLPWDEEGYVVCDESCNKCKIKSTRYVSAHFARNNNVITDKHLIKVILDNEQNEFLIYATDYEKELRSIELRMQEYKNTLNSLRFICDNSESYLDKKSFANVVSKFPPCINAYLFKCYGNGEYTFKQFIDNWNENKWKRNLEEFEKFSLSLERYQNGNSLQQ